MSLLDKLFKRLGLAKESATDNMLTKIELKDILFDWFNHNGVKIEDFKSEFLEPCIEEYRKNERTNSYYLSSPEKAYDEYFDSHAVLYLAAKYPDNEWFELLFDFMIEKEYSVYDLKSALTGFYSNSILRERPELWNILKGGSEILKAYHATQDGRDVNFSSIYGFSASIWVLMTEEHKGVFNIVMDYLADLKFENKAIFFSNALPSSYDKESYPESSIIRLKIETSKAYKLKGLEDRGITEELINDYRNCIQKASYLPAFAEAEHKKRKYVTVKNLPQVQEFLSAYENKRVALFDYHISQMSLQFENRDLKKFHNHLAAHITEDLVVTEERLLSILDHKLVYQADHILLNLLLPVLKNSLKNATQPEKILKKFERLIYIKHNRATRFQEVQSAFDFIGEAYTQRVEEELEEIYAAKYQGPYGMANFDYQSRSIEVTDKKHCDLVLNTLQSRLNQVVPTAIKSVSRQSYYISGITMNIGGEDYSFSNEMMKEINGILAQKELGYRFVPIPLSSFRYNSGTLYNCSYALFNYDSYARFKSKYIKKEFPELVSKKIIWYPYVKIDAPPLQEKAELEVDNSGSQNLFLSDSSWNWFKDQHIDKLASNTDWYAVMDQLIRCKGASKPQKNWLGEMQSTIAKMGQDRYFSELGVLMSDSLKEEFWFVENYRQTFKGIIWSCQLNPNEKSLTILKTIVEAAYTKIRNVGPRSTKIGNMGLNALATCGNDAAFGLMNLMRNKSKYQRFIKAIDKHLAKFMDTAEGDPELLADKTIPDFGFKDNEKIVAIDNKVSILYRIKNQGLTKKWIVNGEEQKSTPALIKSNYRAEEKEVAVEFKRMNSVLKDMKNRVKTYWLFDREWSQAEWSKYIAQHPLVRPYALNMIWTTMSGTEFLLTEAGLLDALGQPVLLSNKEKIKLWHPIAASGEEIKKWQTYIYENKIKQPLRQAFREHYPFSETELAGEESLRFAHHFLKTNKLMAVANSAAWIFTYAHDGYNWPRKYVKQRNLTIHLLCDYHPNDYAIPTKALFFTEGNTTKIQYNRPEEKLKLSEISPVTLSELCRDIDLFIATTSIANDPELSTASADQKAYRGDFYRGNFSDNASAKVRKEIIMMLAPILKLKPEFDKNYMIIKGSLNTYRINLGSGFAQVKGSQKHINLLPDIQPMKKSKKLQIPIQDDETLYIILAKALFLKDDDKIQDAKIKKLLS